MIVEPCGIQGEPLYGCFIYGLPWPQGSKSRTANGHMIEGSSTSGRLKTKQWRTAVAEAAAYEMNGGAPLDGPLGINLVFFYPRPKSRPKSHHGWHTVIPDKDKVLRATFDGLKVGGMVKDDCLFCCIAVMAIERDGASGANVNIWRVLDSAPLFSDTGCPLSTT